jgi:hypothetical protein
MTPDERELLFRIDERVGLAHERHQACSIPVRLAALERKQDRIEGGIALITILVLLGRAYDYFGPLLPHFVLNDTEITLLPLLLWVLQLFNLV